MEGPSGPGGGDDPVRQTASPPRSQCPTPCSRPLRVDGASLPLLGNSLCTADGGEGSPFTQRVPRTDVVGRGLGVSFKKGRRGDARAGGAPRAPRGAPAAGPDPASQLHFSPRGGGGPGVGAGRREGRSPPQNPQLPASALLPQGPCQPPSPLPGGAPALTADPTRASGACKQ